jgi:hypothetical protein
MKWLQLAAGRVLLTPHVLLLWHDVELAGGGLDDGDIQFLQSQQLT